MSVVSIYPYHKIRWKQKRSRLLLVESIHINRADGQKLADQLTLMGTIYASDASDFGWLEQLTDCAACVEEVTNATDGTSEPEYDYAEATSNSPVIETNREECDSILEFGSSYPRASDFESQEGRFWSSTIQGSIVSLAKHHIVNQLMEDFWIRFDKIYNVVTTGCTTTSSEKEVPHSRQETSASSKQNRKRKRKSEQVNRSDDDEEMGDGMEQPYSSSIADVARPQLQFACPYRKNDPDKYNPNDWRVCATTGHMEISRLKYVRLFFCNCSIANNVIGNIFA